MKEYRWADLAIGLKETFSVTVTGAMSEQFVAASGDDNPLHVDAREARARGFKDRVVHGMLVASFFSRLVGVYLPGRFCLLHGVEVSFPKPTFEGDTLEVSGEITHLNEAYRQAELRGVVRNGSGEIVAKAKIRVGLHE